MEQVKSLLVILTQQGMNIKYCQLTDVKPSNIY